MEVCYRFVTVLTASFVYIFVANSLSLSSFVSPHISVTVVLCAQLFASSCNVMSMLCNASSSSSSSYYYYHLLGKGRGGGWGKGVCFNFYIFTTRCQTISRVNSSRIDVRVEERLPTGKA